MDLHVDYLGLKLAHPLMPGASPLVDDLGMVKRLEDAGASAIVMHSLFEEQLLTEQRAAHHAMDHSAESFPEALAFFPQPGEFHLGPDEYLEHIRRIKECVGLPVIASLNGSTPGGWLHYARLMEQAGADALELNVFRVPTAFHEDCHVMASDLVLIVGTVCKQVKIPVSVKLSPFHCSMPDLARKLRAEGARGLVMFNRVFQPDIDLETLSVVRGVGLSDSSELPLRLRWLAILFEVSGLSLSCSGGVHTGDDAVKAILCGAHTVQMVSALLSNGALPLTNAVTRVERWLEDHGYESVAEARGAMSLERCPDPSGFVRGQYVRMLQSWRAHPHA